MQEQISKNMSYNKIYKRYKNIVQHLYMYCTTVLHCCKFIFAFDSKFIKLHVIFYQLCLR